MDIQTFIDNYYAAFSQKAELPIALWYSDAVIGEFKKIPGCLFKALPSIRGGEVVSMNEETIGCGGGNFYTGFAPMNNYIPTFVSQKEKYIQTPEAVLKCIESINVQSASHRYLHLARIDKLTSFEKVEGLLFFATPDILSGLCSWTFFDNASPDAVSTLFGSGCSSAITYTINENRIGGRRTFLGFFDPSVRPYVEKDILSFSIPMSRFKEMYTTMPHSCLYGTHAWSKIKSRISESSQEK